MFQPTRAYRYLFKILFISFGFIYRRRIAGSHGSSSLNFLRKLHTVFCSIYTNFHCHQQCTRVPFSQHPCQHLLLSVLLIVAILMSVRWYLTVEDYEKNRSCGRTRGIQEFSCGKLKSEIFLSSRWDVKLAVRKKILEFTEEARARNINLGCVNLRITFQPTIT